MHKKKRTEIPPDIAARVLFLHDRTCCVCRQQGKPVQIHHIDNNPSRGDPANLAVLCFDCHRETQIKGGFDRKLDSDQVILYRDDWMRTLARHRAMEEAGRAAGHVPVGNHVEIVTCLAEIYRERKEYQMLAIHYDVLGNKELRDKYIELALKQSKSDEDVAFLRGLQGRIDLIPKAVIARKLKQHDKRGDHEQKARFLCELGRYEEATQAYLQGILESLSEKNLFSAAYYLGEVITEGLRERLLEAALREAARAGNLWLQVRALQELGWDTELVALVLSHAKQIESSGDLHLQLELARAKGDAKEILRVEKEIARTETWV